MLAKQATLPLSNGGSFKVVTIQKYMHLLQCTVGQLDTTVVLKMLNFVIAWPWKIIEYSALVACTCAYIRHLSISYWVFRLQKNYCFNGAHVQTLSPDSTFIPEQRMYTLFCEWYCQFCALLQVIYQHSVDREARVKKKGEMVCSNNYYCEAKVCHRGCVIVQSVFQWTF